MTPFAAALSALPTGTFTGWADGKRYIVVKSHAAQGRITKLIAEELGGTDYISLNHFSLLQGDRLKPCEMPEEKVVRFVSALVPDPDWAKARAKRG